MDFTFERNVKLTAILLLIAAVTQAVYTALYVAEADVPRAALWGSEAALFVMTALFAGTAMVQAKRLHIGFVAIGFAAVLNIIQVGVGLTQFGPFFEAAGVVEGMEPAANSVVAYSFMIYNAAKAMLAFGAIIFGMAKLSEGAKVLGGITAGIGAIAFVTNILSMAMGRDWSGELPLAGGSGVLATVLLAVCLFGQAKED
jgi:uncharacterized membrane protein YhaH (DUF805 family)